MMQQLLQEFGMLFDNSRELLLFGLLLGRALPFIFLVPFFGGQVAPPELKMSLGALLAFLLWPVASGSIAATVPTSAFPFVVLMLKETFIGFMLGLTVSHLFHAMETAGRIIDTARGAAMAEVQVPATKSRATPIGSIYFQLLAVIYCSIGGHTRLLEFYFFAYEILPIDGMITIEPGLSPLVQVSIRMAAEVLAIATILASPAIIATFVTDIVFGILNRVAPQLNAYFMAMPVKAMGALVVILAGLQPFSHRLVDFVYHNLVDLRRIIYYLSQGQSL